MSVAIRELDFETNCTKTVMKRFSDNLDVSRADFYRLGTPLSYWAKVANSEKFISKIEISFENVNGCVYYHVTGYFYMEELCDICQIIKFNITIRNPYITEVGDENFIKTVIRIYLDSIGRKIKRTVKSKHNKIGLRNEMLSGFSELNYSSFWTKFAPRRKRKNLPLFLFDKGVS